ncbi:MAG: anthranilate synthase component I family protein [Aigarchaeota archaeon]|nr:anthranilate synthase component I family protein [Aigarchaeota archaeon]MDW8092526.1 anthranilate synthase component I family protein [Nitrososphaerota archaeon]
MYVSCVEPRYDYSFLFESVSGPEKLREYSFIGFDPYAVIKVRGQEIEVVDFINGDVTEIEARDPLEVLRHLIPRATIQGGCRFMGGAVGYVSYDAVRYWEEIPLLKPREDEFYEIELGLYNDGIVIDHRMGEAYAFSWSGVEPDTIEERGVKDGAGELEAGIPQTNLSKRDFERMVERAKEYVLDGDVFQVVLSKRYSMDLKGDPLRFYSNLRQLNPSPYMFYMRMDERLLIGSSPEMLFRVEGGSVKTFPIAGTRPITGDEKLDERLGEELLRDEKELAEHVMLVDLARNDLGRICRYGTVKVRSFMELHKFSHVQHIVSEVEGELQLNMDACDALRATFPAGTVSGAPKVRAMEIIEELEPVRRGPYAGCVGYYSYSGDADFAITIRTLFYDGKRAHVQSGAGIVYDSIPEREWYETEHKAAALLRALGVRLE